MKNTDIMAFMNNNDRTGMVRTTIYIPRHLHESAKIMAVLTRSRLSTLMKEALTEKLKKLREQGPLEVNEKT